MNSNKKRTIAVSSCLLGNEVRYDGSAKPCQAIIDLLADDFELVPFCPEISIGMGVPRGPIQLEIHDHVICARRVTNNDEDFTEKLAAHAHEFLQQHSNLKAIICKKGSPSCGYLSSKLFRDNVLVKENANGIFINEVVVAREDLPVIDEIGFMIASQRDRFIDEIKKP